MEANITQILIVILPLFLQLIGLTIAVAVDPYIRKRHKRLLLINIAILVVVIVQNYIEYYLSTTGISRYTRIAVSVIGYALRPVAIVIFTYIVSDDKKTHLLWILIGINAIISLTAFFSDICFTIGESNNFVRGPLGYSCHVTSGICLAILMIQTFLRFKEHKGAGLVVPLLNAVLIIVAGVLDNVLDSYKSPIDFLTMAMVSCSLFYYVWLHLQFVREHEKALQAEQRIQIMMSQIQPHFLYNTLSTIQALCMIDPKKAFEITEKFGTYLRQNIDSLSQPNLIPLEKELEHTKIYSEIETTRFPQITVSYDIDDNDVMIPALTIQPLVENAIRHGVRIRKDGQVLVSTKRDGDTHIIVIRDNGKGFDTSSIDSIESTHIGIRNVKERIEEMCDGNVEVESILDEGTTITIRIPVVQFKVGER